MSTHGKIFAQMDIRLEPVVRDDASAPFFDGTRAGELLVRRSPDGTYLDPRTDGDAEWVAASGLGTIVSWTVVHGKNPEGNPTRIPLGIVELDEGPWLWCRLAGLADQGADGTFDTLIGRRVTVEFVPSGPDPEHELVPVFRPLIVE